VRRQARGRHAHHGRRRRVIHAAEPVNRAAIRRDEEHHRVGSAFRRTDVLYKAPFLPNSPGLSGRGTARLAARGMSALTTRGVAGFDACGLTTRTTRGRRGAAGSAAAGTIVGVTIVDSTAT